MELDAWKNDFQFCNVVALIQEIAFWWINIISFVSAIYSYEKIAFKVKNLNLGLSRGAYKTFVLIRNCVYKKQQHKKIPFPFVCDV